MFLRTVTPYLIGVVTAPLLAKFIEPMLRGAVKASVGLALEMREAAVEAAVEFQDIVAEANADSARKNATAAAKTK
jgi:Protein of unknown function (DUF5132)